MRSLISAALIAVLLPAAAEAQAGRGRPAAADSAQRAQLEARVLQRFFERTAEELALTGDQTTRLRTLFTDGVDRRRQVARQSAEIRRELAEAVREAGSSDAVLNRHLAALQALRQREHELWLREQQVLAELLTPRQRAVYMSRWLTLQDNVRDLMARRPGAMPRR
jgi:Spy/CpxP family protein refolding chaperone